MKRFKELQESLRSEGAETYTVSKGTYTRKVDGKTADLLKKQGWKLMSREEAEEAEEARQMKDPKKDSMVVKNGKTIVIDKSKEKEYLRKGWTLAEAMNEENVKKGDSVKIINAKKYDALSKPEVSGIVIGMLGSKVMVKVGSGQMNVDPKDLVKESVELDESTAAYAASLEKMANDKQLKGLTKSDRDTLSRLAAMMAKEKKPMKEALSPAFNNSYIGMPDAVLRRKRNAFLDQINDLIKFKKKNKGDKEVVDLEDKVRQINYAMSHKAK
jgi:molybdopterin converting factor small subunit